MRDSVLRSRGTSFGYNLRHTEMKRIQQNPSWQICRRIAATLLAFAAVVLPELLHVRGFFLRNRDCGILAEYAALSVVVLRLS